MCKLDANLNEGSSKQIIVFSYELVKKGKPHLSIHNILKNNFSLGILYSELYPRSSVLK